MLLLLPFLGSLALAATEKFPVLAGIDALQAAGVKPLAEEPLSRTGYALVTEREAQALSAKMHADGKCGGYERLPALAAAESELSRLAARVRKDRRHAGLRERPRLTLERRPEIVAALARLEADRIQSTVDWLSSFPSRYNKLPDPNAHVVQLEAKLRELLKGFAGTWSVTQVSHSSTRQRSLKVHLEGSKRPGEILVLGGHLDSISGWSGSGAAPGADDNASGSASLLEALRVLAAAGPVERSVEFFWYAGEESGLLGSGEIARDYKSRQKNVVAVLQLDMTMFPGSGELVIGNVDDFTSSWLRDYLVAINETYIGARLIPDRCGYACSDHASWYRQGYPTLMPFESDTEHMNSAIHTAQDLSGPRTSARHALAFSKIALVIALELGNSTATQPY